MEEKNWIIFLLSLYKMAFSKAFQSEVSVKDYDCATKTVGKNCYTGEVKSLVNIMLFSLILSFI